jgi:hypothetical protein
MYVYAALPGNWQSHVKVPVYEIPPVTQHIIMLYSIDHRGRYIETNAHVRRPMTLPKLSERDCD